MEECSAAQCSVEPFWRAPSFSFRTAECQAASQPLSSTNSERKNQAARHHKTITQCPSYDATVHFVSPSFSLPPPFPSPLPPPSPPPWLPPPPSPRAWRRRRRAAPRRCLQAVACVCVGEVCVCVGVCVWGGGEVWCGRGVVGEMWWKRCGVVEVWWERCGGRGVGERCGKRGRRLKLR